MRLIDLEMDTNFTLQNQLAVKGQSLGFVSLPRRRFQGSSFFILSPQGRDEKRARALSVVPHFSLAPPHVAFSRVG